MPNTKQQLLANVGELLDAEVEVAKRRQAINGAGPMQSSHAAAILTLAQAFATLAAVKVTPTTARPRL